MRVRFRVDGVLRGRARCRDGWSPVSISRVKIMGDLDIAEKRVPQDGRVGVNVEERRGRPAGHHAADAARGGRDDPHPRKEQAMRTLDELGMDGEDARDRFEDAIRRAYGAVLVTGPTGSGKSTTLYAALER